MGGLTGERLGQVSAVALAPGAANEADRGR